MTAHEKYTTARTYNKFPSDSSPIGSAAFAGIDKHSEKETGYIWGLVRDFGDIVMS